MRLQALSAAVTQMRIFVVVTGAKVTWRQTSVLLVMVPPGTGTQAVPVQYWTSKSRSPYRLNVMLGVGSLGRRVVVLHAEDVDFVDGLRAAEADLQPVRPRVRRAVVPPAAGAPRLPAPVAVDRPRAPHSALP